jgi:peptidoglycan/xylan/chitin deacetylase (PgdA/CDA1 family)
MKAFSIMFHDVIENGKWDSSGFPGPGAAVYKLEKNVFARHLDAIPKSAKVSRADGDWRQESNPVFLTFDDGGTSFLHPIADLLDARGWPGHFFITTGRVGTPGFLTKSELRELRKRGHVVGSHSCSHPTRMSQCSRAQLKQEWSGSVDFLQDLLGEPTPVASVPGGYYSEAVGETAVEAGVRVLFNSEPTSNIGQVNGAALLGRYFVQRGMPPEISAAFAGGPGAPRLKQAAVWKAKKIAKAAGGGLYLKIREKMLSR